MTARPDPAQQPPARAETAKPSTNLDASAWIDAALDVLAEGGIEAVRVDPLAKRLGVTRGSFYWHFKDRDALHQAMLKRWREGASYAVFDRMERSVAAPTERLERLMALPYSSPRSARAAAIELGIRLWARRDRQAAKAVRHIDRVRLSYFERLLKEHGVPAEDAPARAFMFYAAQMAEAFIVTNERPGTRSAITALLLKP